MNSQKMEKPAEQGQDEEKKVVLGGAKKAVLTGKGTVMGGSRILKGGRLQIRKKPDSQSTETSQNVEQKEEKPSENLEVKQIDDKMIQNDKAVEINVNKPIEEEKEDEQED